MKKGSKVLISEDRKGVIQEVMAKVKLDNGTTKIVPMDQLSKAPRPVAAPSRKRKAYKVSCHFFVDDDWDPSNCNEKYSWDHDKKYSSIGLACAAFTDFAAQHSSLEELKAAEANTSDTERFAELEEEREDDLCEAVQQQIREQLSKEGHWSFHAVHYERGDSWGLEAEITAV
ncbi:unnamed protein product [Symbiodinium sp. CCMP2592]|nr:unnamed protein product [Symbiodinium sp. CCMP2592]